MKIMDLLSRKEFWASLFGLVAVLLAHFVPNFPLTMDMMAPFIIMIVSYVMGVAVDPGLEVPGTPIGQRLLALLASSKFWTALVGIAFVFVSPSIGLTKDHVLEIIIPLATFIFGKAVSDRRALTNGVIR